MTSTNPSVRDDEGNTALRWCFVLQYLIWLAQSH